MKITVNQLRTIIQEGILDDIFGKKVKSLDDVTTVGDFKKLIKYAQSAKRAELGKEAAAEWAKSSVMDELLGKIPGAATAKNAADALKAMYDLPDEARTGTALDHMDIDDDVAKIVDDPIENDFLAVLADELENMDDNAPMSNLNVTKGLSNYLEKKFNSRTVSGFSESRKRIMKITKKQLRQVIKESLIAENKMQDIIVNSYEDVEDYNILANYALNNDIKGALADPALQPYIEKNEMGWVADEAGGWFEKVGEWEEMPAPEGWDRDAAYKFLTDLENAAWKVYDKQAKASIASDPDKEFLEFLGNQWTSMIEPSDMPDIKWKEYKRYIRLKPPRSISHGVGEIHVTKEDTENLYPGAWEDFKDFLTTRAGGQLGRRKPYKKSPPPYYD